MKSFDIILISDENMQVFEKSLQPVDVIIMMNIYLYKKIRKW